MSGAHRIQKPPSRFRLTLLLMPVRVVWRAARAAYTTVTDWRRQASAQLRDRWDRRDPFVVEPAASVTSPDPIPAALPAPVEPAAPEPEPEPLFLTPREAYHSLRTEHPYLPAEYIRWHFGADSIHGEVNALDCGPVQQRAVVNGYAYVLGTEVRERDAVNGHILLTATGVYAGVTVIVTAVQVADDTIPLRVYREATSTQETQAISQEVLEQVMSA